LQKVHVEYQVVASENVDDDILSHLSIIFEGRVRSGEGVNVPYHGGGRRK
jgi:hypothetical protein